jgi:hypothetical protein
VPNPSINKAVAQVRQLRAEAEELQRAAGGSITDGVASWLVPQYLLAARERLDTTEGAQHWEVLRAFAHDWAMLRRGDHSAARLQLEREQLELQRANAQAAKEGEFRQWLQRADIRAQLFPEQTGGIKPETLRKIERELRLL